MRVFALHLRASLPLKSENPSHLCLQLYLIMWEPPRDQIVLFAQKHRSLGSFEEDKNGPGASYGCDLEWCAQRRLWETHRRTATTGWEAHLQHQKQWASQICKEPCVYDKKYTRRLIWNIFYGSYNMHEHFHYRLLQDVLTIHWSFQIMIVLLSNLVNSQVIHYKLL